MATEEKNSEEKSQSEKTADRATVRQAREDEHNDSYDPPNDTPLGGITLDKEQAKDNDNYDEAWRTERDSTPESDNSDDEDTDD